MSEKTPEEILSMLNNDIINQPGHIIFTLSNISVTINATDTVGNSIQSFLKQWFILNDIYHDEPKNTQEFPDFFLSKDNQDKHMLEVKAFNYNRTPAFDIANYESYVKSVSEKPYRLDADYIIFGYTMDSEGEIKIKKLWLKKIWEIAGDSKRYSLKTQVKRNVIYNIRPNSDFKKNKEGPFKCREDFLKAIYLTQKEYRGEENANEWKELLCKNYKDYYGTDLILDI